MTQTLKRTWLAVSMFLIAGMSFLPATHVSAAETESEEVVGIHIVGQLIELSSTDAPTTIVVRENPAGEFTDYTVDVTESTVFGSNVFNQTSMQDWINGDLLNIQGTKNTNTGIVTANVIINASLNPTTYRGLNGWIDSIDTSNNQIVVQWNGELHTVNVTDNTRMVVGQINPAAISDFEVGDRVRVRLIKDSDVENEARIIFTLRRGPRIFQLARTRGFFATLNEIDGENNQMNVTLVVNPHLREGDVNNLIGTEGAELTIVWDESTKFVRRFNGVTTEDELTPGDHLFMIGRVNDDGTISVRLVKDNSILRKDVFAHEGEITSFDTDGNTVTVVPVRQLENEDAVEWTVTYDEETVFNIDGQEGTEDDLVVGAHLRARGTANVLQHTVDADVIAIFDEMTSLEVHEARIVQINDEISSYEAEE